MSDTLTQEKADLGSGDAVAPRPDLDGLLVSIPGNPAVWLIMNGGYRKLIPGGATGTTFNNLFPPSATITPDINATDIQEEAPITNGAILARDAGGTVYLITNEVKWPITSGGFSRYQFNSSKVVIPPQVLLDFIPNGGTIDWPQ